MLTQPPARQGVANKTARSRPTLPLLDTLVARDFAAQPADLALRLHGRLRDRVAAEGMGEVYETIERPLISVLARMEQVMADTLMADSICTHR